MASACSPVLGCLLKQPVPPTSAKRDWVRSCWGGTCMCAHANLLTYPTAIAQTSACVVTCEQSNFAMWAQRLIGHWLIKIIAHLLPFLLMLGPLHFTCRRWFFTANPFKDLGWFALQGSIKLNEWKVEAGWGMIVVLSLIELSAFIRLGPLAPRPPTNSTHLFAVCSAYQLSWTWLPVIHFKLWPCCNIFSVKLKPACGFTLTAAVKPHATPFKCIFYRLWRHRDESGPLFAVSSGAKDSLKLISMHLSPWAASCLPQLLIHFLFFLRLSSPSSFVLYV